MAQIHNYHTTLMLPIHSHFSPQRLEYARLVAAVHPARVGVERDPVSSARLRPTECGQSVRPSPFLPLLAFSDNLLTAAAPSIGGSPLVLEHAAGRWIWTGRTTLRLARVTTCYIGFMHIYDHDNDIQQRVHT